MSHIWKNIAVYSTFIFGTVLGLAAMNVNASAQCQPGQLQEANLAFQSANQFLTAKQWDQAIARLQSIVKMCPEYVPASRGIGAAMMGKKDYTGAIPYFESVIELRGNEVEAGDYANLARAYAKLRDYKEARAEFMKAAYLAPDDCGVLFNLGVMHYAAGYHSQSVEVLEHALQSCPQIKAQLLKQLSKSATKAAAQQKRNGNATKAAYYEGLMNHYGGQAGGATTYDMVKTKMKAKDYGGAIVLLEQMLAQNPNQKGAQLTLARAQDAAGKRREAVTSYEKYLKLQPEDAKATGDMIQVMVEAGMCEEANTRAAQAVKALGAQGRKNMAPVMYSWGLALECLKEYETARTQFQACATSGHERYAPFGARQVERMEGLQEIEDAKRKKAKQRR